MTLAIATLVPRTMELRQQMDTASWVPWWPATTPIILISTATTPAERLDHLQGVECKRALLIITQSSDSVSQIAGWLSNLAMRRCSDQLEFVYQGIWFEQLCGTACDDLQPRSCMLARTASLYSPIAP